MASYCTNVVHLSLPSCTKLSVLDLKKLLCEMTHLQHLDVYADGYFVEPCCRYAQYIEKLLKVTTVGGVAELTLRVCYGLDRIIKCMETWISRGNSLPSVVNIFATLNVTHMDSHMYHVYNLFSFWINSRQQKLPPFEIRLYDNKRVPMNLYPTIPLNKFVFGRKAKPPLIRLSDLGINLGKDAFFMNEYDHYGIERHAIIHIKSDTLYNEIIEEHFSYINDLYSVSYVDLSCVEVYSNHLQQLAVVCPNLQRLNLCGNFQCLKDLQGLSAIVQMCGNLEGLNLGGISVSSVKSYLLLWELLSSIKRLSHLAIDPCLLKLDNDGIADADKEKLVTFFKGCCSLRALEMYSDQFKRCVLCNGRSDFLFSHFPSLTHCRMSNFHYSALEYALDNCHQLKYLYEEDAQQYLPTVLGKCNLQQLYISSSLFSLSDKSAENLSSHGKLECVILYVHSITIKGITTLISNSPNLILLHISVQKPAFQLGKVRDTFPSLDRHKLFSVGSFNVVHASFPTPMYGVVDNTDLNSLWPPVDLYEILKDLSFQCYSVYDFDYCGPPPATSM